jgi:hypothetical protein
MKNPATAPNIERLPSRLGHDSVNGSQSYIPPDPKDDKALHTALDLIRGIQKNSAYPLRRGL